MNNVRFHFVRLEPRWRHRIFAPGQYSRTPPSATYRQIMGWFAAAGLGPTRVSRCSSVSVIADMRRSRAGSGPSAADSSGSALRCRGHNASACIDTTGRERTGIRRISCRHGGPQGHRGYPHIDRCSGSDRIPRESYARAFKPPYVIWQMRDRADGGKV